ncbi:MAG: 2-amino-4-hydroxy-6-hydroxymethyldihydropteridine diphosphokinase [Gemmatimonadetes bacterium]|nr:2-amino-4-hydroxy-6-hydroxymethyldihydropteridine diphosphokinase [Gemmatimonadota bacterium]
MAEQVFVALGSNLGDRARHLAEARRLIGALPCTSVAAESAVEDTAPVGPVSQGRYLNQMVLVRTGLAPRELLDALLGIERALGRERGERWGPRTIDLDIVRFGDRVVSEPGLTIPHPELPNRDFWQRELAELAPHGC